MNAPTLFDEFMQETAEALKAEPCRPGDLWQLGNHRLYCGSSTDAHDVAVVMQGEKARLIVTDPQYGMKKEAEGILNDNQNATELLEFNRAWFQVAYDNLDASGSFYVFGNPEPLMDFYAELLKPLIKA